ncbi:MAG: MetQ/NlpA family ABC transporter substrate-binding protein [Succinivibrio sp.]
MNKLVSAALASVFSLGIIAGAPSAGAEGIPETIRFGFCPGPYHEMVEKFIAPQLEKKGYKVEYLDFTDYVTPDSALESKDIDANLMQHQTYLSTIVKDQGLHLTSVVNVPTLGLGVFSDKYKTLDELPEGAKIGIPTDAVNLARALRIASENGLVKLGGNDEKSEVKASVADITDNPKKLEFIPIEAAQISRSLDSLDAGFVPGNYAVAAKLDYSKALAVEKVQENIKNVIAVRDEDKDTLGALLRDIVKSKEFKEALEADHYWDSFTRPEWWNK